uniref:Uncharacterized protein n=1 Tax=Arundo donax TaxID=35708 RepID=A0A0A9HQG1_ARUDO
MNNLEMWRRLPNYLLCLLKQISISLIHLSTKLLKLVLILPVVIASVERVISTMNYVKNKLRNINT